MRDATFPRLVHEARRAYWETSPGVYQASMTPDAPPKGTGGYHNLAALCRLKGDAPPTRSA